MPHGTALNLIVHNVTSLNSLLILSISSCLVNVASSLLRCFILTEFSPACPKQQRAYGILENRTQRNYGSSEEVAIFVNIANIIFHKSPRLFLATCTIFSSSSEVPRFFQAPASTRSTAARSTHSHR